MSNIQLLNTQNKYNSPQEPYLSGCYPFLRYAMDYSPNRLNTGTTVSLGKLPTDKKGTLLKPKPATEDSGAANVFAIATRLNPWAFCWVPTAATLRAFAAAPFYYTELFWNQPVVKSTHGEGEIDNFITSSHVT
jgi:hypothetical protein